MASCISSILLSSLKSPFLWHITCLGLPFLSAPIFDYHRDFHFKFPSLTLCFIPKDISCDFTGQTSQGIRSANCRSSPLPPIHCPSFSPSWTADHFSLHFFTAHSKEDHIDLLIKLSSPSSSLHETHQQRISEDVQVTLSNAAGKLTAELYFSFWSSKSKPVSSPAL